MVWSPLSNLLLYGKTADLGLARDAGVLIALGPDWSPSGSKNLLGELKIARLVGDGLSDADIVALATRNPAKILRWDDQLGSLEAGKRADLLVVSGADGDAHAHLFTRSEHDVELVVVNGVPRYGASTVMRKLLGEAEARAESRSVAGRARLLDLVQLTGDPMVGKLTLQQAADLLADGLHRLPELAKDMDKQKLSPDDTFLVLDHEEQDGANVRPHLPGPDGDPTAMLDGFAAAATPLSDLLVPLTLDPLTVHDDAHFVHLGDAVEGQCEFVVERARERIHRRAVERESGYEVVQLIVELGQVVHGLRFRRKARLSCSVPPV
jgi:hypothetical protein